MNDSPIRPHQKTLIAAAVVSLLLWVVPFFGFILLPLQYLNTHLHEFSHALMATITGGPVGKIEVYSNGSGVTLAGGSPALVSSAGYLGAIILGGLMIWFSRSEKGASITARAIAVLLAFSLIFWVRGDLVGVISAILWLGLLAALPSLLKGRDLVFVVQLLGMQQCLAGVQSLYTLLRISTFAEVQSDATNMAHLTGIPALFWAAIWSVTGLAVLAITLRYSWSSRQSE